MKRKKQDEYKDRESTNEELWRSREKHENEERNKNQGPRCPG